MLSNLNKCTTKYDWENVRQPQHKGSSNNHTCNKCTSVNHKKPPKHTQKTKWTGRKSMKIPANNNTGYRFQIMQCKLLNWTRWWAGSSTDNTKLAAQWKQTSRRWDQDPLVYCYMGHMLACKCSDCHTFSAFGYHVHLCYFCVAL